MVYSRYGFTEVVPAAIRPEKQSRALQMTMTAGVRVTVIPMRKENHTRLPDVGL